MVKLRQNKNILGSRIEISRKYPKRRPREREKSDSTPATTTASPVAPHLKSLKKCVVKLKRLSNVKLFAKCQVSNLNDAPEASNSGEAMFQPELLRNSTMIFQMKEKDPKGSKHAFSITPCRVRIERLPLSNSKAQAAKKGTIGGNQTEHRFFHRDQPPTRTRSSVTRNVYEFLSQSQIEDVEERHDPAEDIIKKMVSDGRACIMTRSRKPGRFRAKPVKKKVRPVGKRRQCSIDEIPLPAAKSPVKQQKVMSPIYELETDSIDQDKTPLVTSHPAKLHQAMSPIYELEADSSDEGEPDNMEPMQVTAQVHVPNMESPASAAAPTSLKSVNEPSAYSHLARSVLLNQTLNHSSLLPSARRREQLDMVRQYISTPLNGKGGNAVTSTISPIPAQATRVVSSPGASTPWRVSPESPLPDTFRFGFNSSNLPSFSSEHPQTRHVYVPDDNPQPASPHSICPAMEEEQTLLGSENHSNEENMPPSATGSNENMENLVHLPNPRRTLQHRKPLGDINILEVVHLPPWKKNTLALTTPPKGPSANLFGTDKLPTLSRSPSLNSSRHASRNLFGFEEFIDSNEQLENEAQQAKILSPNKTLNDKLRHMKKLRPSDKELPQPVPVPMRYIYIETDGPQTKQLTIKQMLCSTMIAPAMHTSTLNVDDSVGLFADNPADPEASFDHKKPRRTYVRERPKRKRKQRVKVLYIDTDSSDDEQDSLENSTSPHKAPTKRARKDPEQEAKLREFVTSFNKQCEEVEKFPVVIE